MSTAPRFHKLRQRLFRTRPDDLLPLTVEHQRIYILPTARGCAFVGALLLMLIASVNYDLSLGYALCFLLTGLFSSCLLHTYRNMAGLGITAIHTEACFAGEAATFGTEITAPEGRARQSIDVMSTSTTLRHRTTVQHIEPGTSARAELAIPGERRGHLPLGRLTLASSWPLGLWRAWSYVHSPAAAIVWPAPEPDAPPLPLTVGESGAGVPQASVDGDVAGLRNWTPGDAPSRVVWKRVARGDDLQVRLLETSTRPATTELALEATRLSAVEAQLSRLAAWVLRAEQQGSDYALRLPGVALDAARGRRHRSESLDALAVHGLGPA